MSLFRQPDENPAELVEPKASTKPKLCKGPPTEIVQRLDQSFELDQIVREASEALFATPKDEVEERTRLTKMILFARYRGVCDDGRCSFTESVAADLAIDDPSYYDYAYGDGVYALLVEEFLPENSVRSKRKVPKSGRKQ